MAEHWNGGSGGKGSKPRPFGVPLEEFGESHTRIFGEKKKARDNEYWAKLKAETEARLAEANKKDN